MLAGSGHLARWGSGDAGVVPRRGFTGIPRKARGEIGRGAQISREVA